MAQILYLYKSLFVCNKNYTIIFFIHKPIHLDLVVRKPIYSANPGLIGNQGFYFFLDKGFTANVKFDITRSQN